VSSIAAHSTLPVTTMQLELEVQDAADGTDVPREDEVRRWTEAALKGCGREAVEVAVRFVGEAEGKLLNQRYRKKAVATNVLSFPFENPPGVATDMLGDIVICAPVVEREAREQGLPARAHWAHMVVHGALHLRGYDHVEDEEARTMEALESRILKGLGFDDPYS